MSAGIETSSGTTPDTIDRMDRMYRHQRHIYDLTRKFYLLGRDRLVDGLDPPPGASVCEVGCGTARNLIRLARRRPDLDLYGLDASAPMLRTAARTLRRLPTARICLAHGLAESWTYRGTFSRDRPFDLVFFSYALSMIPPWQDALANALANLRPGGELRIVDFHDAAGLPGWFAAVLRRWLALFGVTPRGGLANHVALADIAAFSATPLYRRYAIQINATIR
jgi:S-adenosylmethionine-diacylgycerolhomoserine-N-methlytransferase